MADTASARSGSAAPRVETGLVYAHGLAALATLFISVAFGIFASIQLLAPDVGAGIPWLSWGRMRYAHTQGIMLGWLGNAFFAFLYHAVPMLTGRAVTSASAGTMAVRASGTSRSWRRAGCWSSPASASRSSGPSSRWPSTPSSSSASSLAAVQFLPPFFRRGLEYLYVSSWYVIGGLVFTLLAYPMGNIVPEFVPGARGAAFSGLWIHDAIGLFVTPLALAIIYFVDSGGDQAGRSTATSCRCSASGCCSSSTR